MIGAPGPHRTQPRPPRAARTTTLLVVLLAASMQAATAADIYRCEDGGTIVFADRPCDERAVLHTSTGSISVVEAPGDLAQIAERNADYLDTVESERAERAQARAEARRAEADAARRVTPMVRTVPVYPFPAYGYGTRPSNRPPRAPSDRLEALRGSGRATDAGRRIPISATSGRQLGSRRPDDDG